MFATRRWAAVRMAGRPARAGFPFSPLSTKAPDEPTEADVRLAVLEAALLHVPEKGWSTEAMAFGAESAGYPAMTHGVFTRGPIELVEYVRIAYTTLRRPHATTSPVARDDLSHHASH